MSFDAIWHFALGVGDDNPLWWDQDYASRTPLGRMCAPPTFLYSCSSGGLAPGEIAVGEAPEELLPDRLGLWASDRWVWHARAWLGEDISATTEVWDVTDRRGTSGRRSVGQVDKIAYQTGSGRLLAECFQTNVFVPRMRLKPTAEAPDLPMPTYGAAYRSRLSRQYETEIAQRRGTKARYWDDVRVGDSLGVLGKGPLTLTSMVGWLLGCGSPLCRTNRMAYQLLQARPGLRLMNPDTGVEDTLAASHWDPYFIAKSGLARGYDYGSQRISWMAHLLTDWAGDEGFLSELEVKLRQPNFFGDTTWITGEVTGKGTDDQGSFVQCSMQAENQRGTISTQATAKIRLPTKLGKRSRHTENAAHTLHPSEIAETSQR